MRVSGVKIGISELSDFACGEAAYTHVPSVGLQRVCGASVDAFSLYFTRVHSSLIIYCGLRFHKFPTAT